IVQGADSLGQLQKGRAQALFLGGGRGRRDDRLGRGRRDVPGGEGVGGGGVGGDFQGRFRVGGRDRRRGWCERRGGQRVRGERGGRLADVFEERDALNQFHREE